MRRTDQRRAAVIALYQADITDRPLELLDPRRDRVHRELVEGVEREREQIDALIERHAEGWTLDRMAPLERNILRVALFELLTATTCPPRWPSTRRSRRPRSCAAPSARLRQRHPRRRPPRGGGSAMSRPSTKLIARAGELGRASCARASWTRRGGRAGRAVRRAGRRGRGRARPRRPRGRARRPGEGQEQLL